MIFKNKGFSVVELMVSIALGLVLTAGVLQVVVSTQGSYRDLVQQARMQESGKLAIDYIVRDMRNVGFWGCSDERVPITNSIKDTSGAVGFDLDKSLFGFSAVATETELNNLGTQLGLTFSQLYKDALLNNSDVVEMRYINVDTSFQITEHKVNSANFELNTDPGFADGTLWAIVDANCSSIGVFVQTHTASSKVGHNSGNEDPLSNCSKYLKGYDDCDNWVNNGEIKTPYSPGSYLYGVETVSYMVTDSSINGLKTLKRVSSSTGGGQTEELVDGVKSLTFRYGIDTDDDGSVNLFATASQIHADAGLDFNDVMTVKISLVVGSYEDVGIADQTFSSTVRIRNRGI